MMTCTNTLEPLCLELFTPQVRCVGGEIRSGQPKAWLSTWCSVDFGVVAASIRTLHRVCATGGAEERLHHYTSVWPNVGMRSVFRRNGEPI